MTASQAIVIDAQHAFGTGKHPTTRMCLKYINHLVQGEPSQSWLGGRQVLDFGCGTGLLAIAAVKLGAKRAIGVELDHQSVQTARRNVALNGLTEKIEIREGSWDVLHETYDLILANLVPSALLRIGNHIPLHLKSEGKVVISGFGRPQMSEMGNYFMEFGLIPAAHSSAEGWGLLVMENKRR